MLDTKTRLLDAQRVLHHLELQVEQYTLHLEGLAAHRHEAERARAMLERMKTELASQRTYCNLLARAGQVEELSAKKNGSSRVA
jgi:hypothetical protein